MEKIIYGILGLLLAGIVALLLVSNIYGRSLKQVTGTELDKISYIKDANQKEVDLDEFLKKYGEVRFRQTDKRITKKDFKYNYCYSEDDTLLFTFVEIDEEYFIIKYGYYAPKNDFYPYLYTLIRK